MRLELLLMADEGWQTREPHYEASRVANDGNPVREPQRSREKESVNLHSLGAALARVAQASEHVKFVQAARAQALYEAAIACCVRPALEYCKISVLYEVAVVIFEKVSDVIVVVSVRREIGLKTERLKFNLGGFARLCSIWA